MAKFLLSVVLQSILFIATTSADSQQQLSPVWSYECQNSVCVKVLAVATAASGNAPPAVSAVSLSVCRLLCPSDPGTVWPKVRGEIDLKQRQLAVINLNDIRLSAADVVNHFDFWPVNRQRFVKQLRNKVPKSSRQSLEEAGQSICIKVNVTRKESEIWKQTDDESYRIATFVDDAATSGSGDNGGGHINVLISAATIFGARHGLETLAQLVVFDDIRQQLLMPSEFRIDDAPAFPHRGLLLDTARNYFSVESIKRTIGE